MVKNLPASAGDSGSIPGLGRSPGERNGNHSSIPAWRIPWTEEHGRLQFMGSKESDTTTKEPKGLFWVAGECSKVELWG